MSCEILSSTPLWSRREGQHPIRPPSAHERNAQMHAFLRVSARINEHKCHHHEVHMMTNDCIRPDCEEKCALTFKLSSHSGAAARVSLPLHVLLRRSETRKCTHCSDGANRECTHVRAQGNTHADRRSHLVTEREVWSLIHTSIPLRSRREGQAPSGSASAHM